MMLGNRPLSFFTNLDRLLVAGLLLGFYVFAYYYANKLNALGFYGMMNVAFDFDQSVFVEAIDGSYLSAISTVESIWIKHPFIYLYSYISAPLQFFGLSRFDAVAIICLTSVATSLFLMWKTFMLITKDSVLALLLLFLLASTSSILSIAVVFDSYSLLSTWSALAIYLFCREYYQARQTPTFILAFIYTMLTGITVYMVLLVFLIEVFKVINNIKHHKANFQSECRRLFDLTLLSLIYGITLMLITYPEQFFVLLSSPPDYFKRVLWAVIRPGEQASIFQVFYILFVNGLVAPTPKLVPILDGFSMLDLRSLQYTFLQFGALFFIYLIFTVSLFKQKRIIIMPCLIFLFLSFIFHIEYHDRGSLFLYTSHLIFPIFVCIAAGMQSIKSRLSKIILAGVIAISCWSSINMLSYLHAHIQTFI